MSESEHAGCAFTNGIYTLTIARIAEEATRISCYQVSALRYLAHTFSVPLIQHEPKSHEVQSDQWNGPQGKVEQT